MPHYFFLMCYIVNGIFGCIQMSKCSKMKCINYICYLMNCFSSSVLFIHAVRLQCSEFNCVCVYTCQRNISLSRSATVLVQIWGHAHGVENFNCKIPTSDFSCLRWPLVWKRVMCKWISTLWCRSSWWKLTPWHTLNDQHLVCVMTQKFLMKWKREKPKQI